VTGGGDGHRCNGKIGLRAATLSDFRGVDPMSEASTRLNGGAMNPLGDNLLAWLVLAFGGAMCIGTLMAMVRPPEPPRGAPARGQARRSGAAAPPRQVPLARSIVFIAVGGLAALWALASLLR
jgi:hypothetical protein